MVGPVGVKVYEYVRLKLVTWAVPFDEQLAGLTVIIGVSGVSSMQLIENGSDSFDVSLPSLAETVYDSEHVKPKIIPEAETVILGVIGVKI